MASSWQSSSGVPSGGARIGLRVAESSRVHFPGGRRTNGGRRVASSGSAQRCGDEVDPPAHWARTEPGGRMGGMKALWASVQGDPVFMRRVNGWLAVFWIIMIPISMMMGWLNSVVYVSALSLWALVSGHWSAWQAARVEVQQQRAEHEAAEADLPTEVADQVIERTTLEAETA